MKKVLNSKNRKHRGILHTLKYQKTSKSQIWFFFLFFFFLFVCLFVCFWKDYVRGYSRLTISFVFAELETKFVSFDQVSKLLGSTSRMCSVLCRDSLFWSIYRGIIWILQALPFRYSMIHICNTKLNKTIKQVQA